MAYFLLKRGIGICHKAITRLGAFQPSLRGRDGTSAFFARSLTTLSVSQRDKTCPVPTRASAIERSFHVSALYRSNCDFLTPCDCSDCMEAARKPLCEICDVKPTVHQTAENGWDHMYGKDYKFTSFCKQCWEGRLEEEKQVREARERSKEEDRKRRQAEELIIADHVEGVRKLMEHIKNLPPGELVPIRYAVQKFLDEIESQEPRWHRKYLFDKLSQELRIVKVGRRYMCDKDRVDAMDFKSWYEYRWRLGV